MSQSLELQRRKTGRFTSGWRDVTDGAKSAYLWFNLALEDLRSRYKRTYLGYLWLVLLFFLQIGVFILIFAPMRQVGSSDNYAAYLSFGFLVWMFILPGVNTGTTVFTESKGWILSANVPYTLFIYRNLCRESLPLIINFILLLLIFSLRGEINPETVWISFMVLPIYALNFLWVGMLLGVVCARFRDLQQLMQLVSRISFFLTPIFWTYEPGEDGMRNTLAIYNPFTHFLEVFRQPMLGGMPTETNVIVVACITVIGPILAFIVFALNRRRLPFWL